MDRRLFQIGTFNDNTHYHVLFVSKLQCEAVGGDVFAMVGTGSPVTRILK